MPDLDAIIVRAVVAFVCATAVSVVAWSKRLLDPGGAVAAIFLGTALVAFGGWSAGILLIAFFLTSSLLSVAEHDHPSRAWQQVIANGAPATFFATLAFLARITFIAHRQRCDYRRGHRRHLGH